TKSRFFWATSAGSGAVSRVPLGLIDASWYVLPALSRSVMPITLSGTTLLSTCINALRRLSGQFVKNKYLAKLKHLVYFYRPGSASLRLFGNIRIDSDLTMDEILHQDAEALLRARGVAYTTWSGGCPESPIDWDAVIERASLVPVVYL